MTGIAAYGCYLPRRRLPLALLQGNAAAEGGPERTVAWADEDSVTMGVAAARDCLAGRDRGPVDLLIFATTTYAFAEKQGAVIIARALGLAPRVRTLDIAHSLRAGLQALQSALDAVAAGSARQALVVIADCRMGAPGSDVERNGGDAAVAFLIGAAQVARVVGAARCGEEIVDVWRRSGDRFTHGWEDRFVTQHGYLVPAGQAARALQEAGGSAPWRWAIGAPEARSHASLAARLKLDKSSLEPPLFDRIGFCGAAHAPLLLCAALDSASAGYRIAMLGHGDGAEALLFEVIAASGRGVVASALSRRLPIASIEHYRRARDLMIGEYPPVDDQGISATVHFRERDENLSLTGQRCACGAHQFPRGRVCGKCGARDRWEACSYAESRGHLVTYTHDSFYPAPDPPTAVGIVEIEDGPRIHMQIADILPKSVEIGMPLAFAFRRVHQAGGRPNYFWKAVPAGDAP